jgi:ankyrin repeat protein
MTRALAIALLGGLALAATGCFDRGKQIRKTAWDGDREELGKLIKTYPDLINSIAPFVAPPPAGGSPMTAVVGATFNELFLERRSSFETADAEGNTALHLASALGNLEIAEILIGGGADLNATNHYGATPLITAAAHKQRELVLRLVRAGARFDVRTAYGVTPLHMAAGWGSSGNPELLLMLESGAPAGMTNATGVTPLHTAARNNQTDAVAMLLNFHAPIDAVDSRLDTPLHVAARNHALEAVKLLLARGANPDSRNYYGETPLFVCIATHNWTGIRSEESGLLVIEALLRGRARVDITNTLGETAISVARAKPYLRIVKLLENPARAHD